MGKRTILAVIAALIIAIIFTACPTHPETVNQQLYPYLVVDSSGAIRVAAYVQAHTIRVPDDIELPNGKKADRFCGFLTDISKYAVTEVIFEPGITSICNNAFSGAANLSNVKFEVGSKLLHVGDNAFKDTQLTEVRLPDGLDSIGDGAFSGTGITELVIPESVTSIGRDVFAGTEITSLSIPVSFTGNLVEIFGESIKTTLQSITIIGDGDIASDAFADFSALTDVIVKL